MKYCGILVMILILFIPMRTISAQRIVVITPVRQEFSYDPAPSTEQIWATGLSFFNRGIPVALKIVNERSPVSWQVEFGYNTDQLLLRFDGKQQLLELSRSDTYLYFGIQGRYFITEEDIEKRLSFDLGIGALLEMNNSYSIGAEAGVVLPLWDETGSDTDRYPTASLFLLYWL